MEPRLLARLLASCLRQQRTAYRPAQLPAVQGVPASTNCQLCASSSRLRCTDSRPAACGGSSCMSGLPLLSGAGCPRGTAAASAWEPPQARASPPEQAGRRWWRRRDPAGSDGQCLLPMAHAGLAPSGQPAHNLHSTAGTGSRSAALQGVAHAPASDCPATPPGHGGLAALRGRSSGLRAPSGQRRAVWNDAPGGSERPATAAATFYDSSVEQFALQPIEQLTLGNMLAHGRAALHDPAMVLRSAQFVQQELPKRLARRLMDLQFLPHIVVANPHIRRVYDAYLHAFDTLRALPPVQTAEDNAAFTVLLKRLVDEHAPMLDALAAGVRECSAKPFVGAKLALDGFLDGMLRSRISRRVLAEQHLTLAQRRPGYVGVISTDLTLREAADFAAQRCKQVCMETYGVATDVVVTGDMQARLPYIPNHLDYMLYELLKNAMRATVQHRPPGQPHRRLLPVIHIRICQAPHDVTIRISDQGGGIADNELDLVWKYGYTTIDRTDVEFPVLAGGAADLAGLEGRARNSMGGLGFGLPLSRLYARYFGGDLKLVSMPGYGVDAFLNLKRLEGSVWREQHVEEAQSLLVLRE